jgi:Ca2+-binding RTX toxin-like protein
VGVLTTADQDTGDSHSYALLDDAGGRFALSGSTLLVGKGSLLDFEQARSHQVVVRATDQGGLSFDQILTVTLQDVFNERVGGTGGDDKVAGGAGADRINAGNGNDIIDAGAGKDVVNGGNGNDRLIGGKGVDTLTGGKGKDVFSFGNKDTGGSKKSADYITDFRYKEKDRIDLKGIDGNTKKKGDQGFSFIGKGDFTKAGQLRYEKVKKETYVYLNTDNDKSAEAVIRLKGALDLQKGWFFL